MHYGLLSFVLYCLATTLVVEACSTKTYNYNKDCCTTKITYQYCTSSDAKIQLENETKQNKGTNKWGQIVIPGNTSGRKRSADCTCEVPFIECVEIYNDYAMSMGFDLIIFDQITVDGHDEFHYKKK